MQRPVGHFKRWARTFTQGTPGGLSRVFAPWMELPQHFGGGKRTRLFSPLRDLLAFSLAGAG